VARPVTDSLKLIVKGIGLAPVGEAGPVTVAVGAVRINRIDRAVKLPLPAPEPPAGTLPMSMTESLSTKSSPIVPVPEPVLTVTVRVLPESVPVLVIDAPVIVPVIASVKSPALTPVTASLKVTVKLTLAAVVGSVPARTIEATTGARFTPMPVELLLAAGKSVELEALIFTGVANNALRANEWTASVAPSLTTYMVWRSRQAPLRAVSCVPPAAAQGRRFGGPAAAARVTIEGAIGSIEDIEVGGVDRQALGVALAESMLNWSDAVTLPKVLENAELSEYTSRSRLLWSATHRSLPSMAIPVMVPRLP